MGLAKSYGTGTALHATLSHFSLLLILTPTMDKREVDQEM